MIPDYAALHVQIREHANAIYEHAQKEQWLDAVNEIGLLQQKLMLMSAILISKTLKK